MKNELGKLLIEILKVPYINKNTSSVIKEICDLYNAKEVYVSKKELDGNKSLKIDNDIFYIIVNNKNNINIEDEKYITKCLKIMHENIAKHEVLMIDANYDKATGLYNKNKFIKYLNDFDKHNNKYDFITCFFIDINGLHDINNLYGHQIGDDYILKVASSIKEEFKKEEVSLFRIGGDEFVGLTTTLTDLNIQEMLTSLRKKLNEQNIDISFGT